MRRYKWLGISLIATMINGVLIAEGVSQGQALSDYWFSIALGVFGMGCTVFGTIRR